MEIRPDDPGANFVIETIVRDPKWSMPYLHYHDSYELYFLEKGTHNTLIGDTLLSLNEQDVALYKPNVLHKSHNTKGYTRTCIYFTQDYLEMYFSARAIRTLTKCFEKLVISLDKETFMNIRKSNLIFAYLSEILTTLGKNMTAFSPVKLSPEQERMTAVLQHINKNYNTIDNIEEIADKFYITKYHLCRIFKASTGLTLIEYINHIKIQHACEMLKSTKKSITQIGMDCGFNSSMYFCKTFQKIIHMSPGEYRRMQ